MGPEAKQQVGMGLEAAEEVEAVVSKMGGESQEVARELGWGGSREKVK